MEVEGEGREASSANQYFKGSGSSRWEPSDRNVVKWLMKGKR